MHYNVLICKSDMQSHLLHTGGKLAVNCPIDDNSKIMLQNMKSSNMYIKPQGNLGQVNMRKEILHPFISLQELSQCNVSGYSQQ